MTPDEYQANARRTRAPQDNVPGRFGYKGTVPIKDKQTGDVIGLTEVDIKVLTHGTVGICSEAGELAGAMERFLWYGKDLDVTNIKEELGDLLWYIAEACDGLGVSMGSLMEGNIAKLRKRFPDKFGYDLVAEENRNRPAEMQAMLRAMDDGPDYSKEEQE